MQFLGVQGFCLCRHCGAVPGLDDVAVRQSPALLVAGTCVHVFAPAVLFAGSGVAAAQCTRS